MNKAEHISAIAEKTGFSKKDVEKFIDAQDEVVYDGLASDGRVRLGNLGYFNVSYRASRPGRNPRNPEEKFMVPETAAVTFKPTEDLKVKVAVPEIIAKAKAKLKSK